MDDSTPIFLKLAAQIEAGILAGDYEEGAQVPSTNELSAFHRINPATAGKALGVLVERGVLEKRRGLGMYVTRGARQRLVEARSAAFASRYLSPLLAEAHALGLSIDEVIRQLTDLSDHGGKQ